MPVDHETTRVRNLPEEDLREYINIHGTDSPERKHALHVLDDRHQRKNQKNMYDLIKVIDDAAKSSDDLGGKIFALNVILTIATVVGAFATFATAWPQIKDLIS
jgi:hypothetical protein